MASNGNSGPGSMRPRANTISHVDNSALAILGVGNSYGVGHDAVGLGLNHANTNGLPGVTGYHFRGMSTAPGHHGQPHGLPKLETRNREADVGSSLKTAPAYGNFGNGLDFSSAWHQPGSTVNPAQLHFATSPHFAFDSPQSPFGHGFTGFAPTQSAIDGDGSFPWLSSFENQMSFNEQAIDTSTPSDSDGSPDGVSEMMLDNTANAPNSTEMWQTPNVSQANVNPGYSPDAAPPTFSDLYNLGQLSPKSLSTQFGADQYYPTPPLVASQALPSIFPGIKGQDFHPPVGPQSDTPSNSAASISSSNRLSSLSSLSTDSITDVTRNALLTSLSQQSLYGYNNLKTSQPQISSINICGPSGRSMSTGHVPLPSTMDLQRYVGAYIQYFHPHLPFLHIPSLSFDSPVYTSVLRASGGHLEGGHPSVAGGGGALILAMAAIGALYEYDFGPSKELFDLSRTMIRLYTGERRKADMSSTIGGSDADVESENNAPLWLVQAMLLNVIYGHNCGDKVAAGIASTLCGAVVNLARSAKLVLPPSDYMFSQGPKANGMDVEMTSGEGDPQWGGFSPFGTGDVQNEWLHWKQAEERKRTLYAIFILSSLLVSAYNHPPALMNSEIRLDLPCDESLWSAESAEAWRSLGGSVFQHEVSFATAMTSLLTAHQREQSKMNEEASLHERVLPRLDELPSVDFKPSTFGCLVLINALHNYIWETRQRHSGLDWTTQETEAMHARIRPALQTWQSAWSANSDHSMERPNPFGANSLSADCIPLLDLAYLRLFVNLGRSKEAFFKRDWDLMAEELAHGKEIVQHADYSPSLIDNTGNNQQVLETSIGSPALDAQEGLEDKLGPLAAERTSEQCSTSSLKRERHLRKAAFLAANSLALSERLGVTFADFNSRELPLQSALCAFDCAQVLAEWVSTLQQRVGLHLGILGKEQVDHSDLSSMIFLEKEDRELMGKIDELLNNLVNKLDKGSFTDSVASTAMWGESGYGSKILLVHATMFERASIWPCESFCVYRFTEL